MNALATNTEKTLPKFELAVIFMYLITDDVELSAYLLNHAGVAVVPGLAFGLPGYFRLSFATSRANLQKAVVRIREALAALR